MILKLTPVVKSGITARPEMARGNFNSVVKGLADEVKKTTEFRFIVVTKIAPE